MAETSWSVELGPDIEADLAADRYDIVEVTNAFDPSDDPASPTSPARILHDGTRLVLPLGVDDTADDRYSTTEVASNRRFDQGLLDRLGAEGSPRVLLPGRQAVWRDVVFCEAFGDDRAAAQHTTAGCCAQSWTGLRPEAFDPRFIGLAFFYTGRRGDEGPDHVDVRKPLVALVGDAGTGLGWVRPLDDLDPTTPHDLVIRWHPSGDVEFLVDHGPVAHFEAARSRRPLSVQPAHLDCWVNCASSAGPRTVENGVRFTTDLWVAIGGLAVEPLA